MGKALAAALRLAGWGALGLVGASLILLLGVQVDPVGGWLLRGVAGAVAPEWLSVEVRRVSGSWLGGLTLEGLRVEDRRTDRVIEVDALRLRYNPLRWRPGRIVLDSAGATGARVSWPLAPREDPAPRGPASESSGISLVVETAELTDGALALVRLSGPAFRLDSTVLRAGDVRLGAGLEVGDWVLRTRFAPADRPVGWGRVEAAGGLTGRVLALDTVVVHSPGSRVHGSGRIPLDSTLTRPGGLRWSLEATPLALADLGGLVTVPAVMAGDSLALTTWARESGDSARVHLEFQTGRGGGGGADLRWVGGGGTWEGDLRARVEGVSLRRYLGEGLPEAPLRLSASGDLTLRTDGPGGPAVVGDGRVDAAAGAAALGAEVRISSRSGSAPDSLRLSLDTLAWSWVTLSGGRVAAVRAGDEVRVDGRVADPAGGTVTVRGRLDTGSDSAPGPWETRISMRGFQDPFSGSVLNGTLQASGTGVDPWEARGGYALSLGPARVREVELDTLDLEGSWNAGEARLRAFVASDRGDFSLAGGATLSPEAGRIRLDSAVLASVAPAPGGEGGVAPMDLTGILSGEVRWEGPPATVADPGRIRGTAAFRGPGSRMGRLELDSVRARASWDRGAVSGEAVLRFQGSSLVEMEADGTVLDSLVLRLRRGRFLRLSPAAFGLPPSAELDGTVTGVVRRTGPDSPWTGRAHLELDPSRVGSDTIQRLEVRVEASQASLAAILDAELGGGGIQAELEGPWNDRVEEWRGRATADLPGLGGFFGSPDSAVTLQASAVLEPGADSLPELRLAVPSASGWGATVDTLALAVRLGPETLVVDTVLLRSNLAVAAGAGELPAALLRRPDSATSVPVTDSVNRSFAVRAVLADSVETVRVAGIGRIMARAGSLHVASVCDPSRCALSGGLHVQSLLAGPYSVASLTAAAEGGLEPGPRLAQMDVQVRVRGVRSPTARIRDTRLDAALQDGLLTVDASSLIDDAREAELGVDLDLRPEGRRATIRTVRFRMDEDRWSLREPATVEYGGPGIHLDTLEILAGDQRVLAEGRWGGTEGHDFTLRLDSVRIGTLSDLMGAPGLDGFLDATVDGYGRDPQPFLEATASGRLQYRDRPPHQIRIQADRNRGFVALDARVLDARGQRRLRLAGEAPLAGGVQIPWGLDATADSLPVAWLEPYLPRDAVRGLEGTASAEVEVRGPRDTPTARGPLRMDGGRLTLPALGIALRDVQLRSSLDGRTLTVDSLRVRSGGRARATGSVALPSLSEPPELDVSVRARDFLAVDTRMVRALVEGDLELTGTLDRPRVSGAVEVLEADLRLDEGLGGPSVEEVTLTDQDWAVLQSRFGILPPDDPRARDPRLLQAAEVDLSVSLGRDIWLRQSVNPEMAVQFTGEVAVDKSPGQDHLQLQGQLDAIPQRSYLEQFGRRFELESGSVFFRGPPQDTEVRISARYRVPPRDGDDSQVTVGLGLTGEVGQLALTLSSSPEMSNSDIVSYLATGRPAADAFSGGGEGTSAADLGTDVLASQLTGLVEQFALRDVGLDVVEIQRDGLREATLVAGQYVTPELFLGFRQPISFGQGEAADTGAGATEAEVEWRALRWLLLHLETGGEAFRFFLEGSIGY